MTRTVIIAVLAAALSGSLIAQEEEYKKVPKDSVRVFVPGCTKGYIFTAGPRAEDQVGRSDIPEGMHLRMNGPKKMMAEIKAHEGSMIELTGLMKKGQYGPGGVQIAPGIRIMPVPSPSSSGLPADPALGQVIIDVENWRPAVGGCPSR